MKRKNSVGFTLIELMVVMVVLMTIGLMIGAILVTALRGSSKTLIVTNVRENGNYALQQMSRQLRYAKTFYGASLTGTAGSYVKNCTPIPSPQYKYLQFEAFSLDTVTIACSTNALQITTTNPNTGITRTDTLIETNSTELVACQFTCSQNVISSPYTIGIDFSLKQKTSSTLVERVSSVIPFQTSVTLRNSPK